MSAARSSAPGADGPGPAAAPWAAIAATASAAADVMWTMQLGEEALKLRQRRRLTALLEAARRSPLYAPSLQGRDPASLQLEDLPVRRKPELMQRFDDWVADPALQLGELRLFMADPAQVGQPYLGRYTVWESSGSSGEPTVFVQDERAMAVYDALEWLRRWVRRPAQRLLDPLGLQDRFAFVGATGGHFASVASVERLRRSNPWLAQTLRSVSFLQPLPRIAEQLERFAPTVLATYPSAAAILAEEHAAGRLRIATQEVWTGGETLTPALRCYVERSFGCPLTNSYGASEFLALAFECPQRRLHLNSDWVILEPVDAQGRAVHGEMGDTTLITNLANHVQPLIRVDLGDRVRLHEARSCGCGSVLPWLEVLGRSDDMLHLGRAPQRVRLAPLALTAVLEDEAGLFDFELVQRGPAELSLATSLHGADARRALERGRRALANFLVLQGASGVRIDCREGVHAHRGRSGKTQRVRQAMHGA